MKKLPSIYQNNLTKDIFNNKKKCYCEKKSEEPPIDNIINEVFSTLGYPYNIELEIKTKDKIYNTSLIAKTKTSIITIDNDTIPISEIIAIKKKKN